SNPTGNATIGTQNTATLNILDNDSTIQFSSPVFSVNEDGTPIAAVTVTRTGNTSTAAAATVNLTNGTATGGSQPFAPGTDYNNAAQVVNFASGETSKTVVIPINDDLLVEGTETVNLTLFNPTGGATIGTQNTATLSILDNDSSIQFGASNFTVNEDGTPVLAVTVTRTGDTTTPASATVNLNNGTATGGSQPFAAGTDFDNAAQVVNFASGETSKTVLIPINDDTDIEPTETVNLSLSNPTGNATIGAQNTATLNILDNDSSIQFSNPQYVVNEDGTAILAVTVTRTGNTTNAASVTLNLADDTATGGSQPFAAGTDYNNAAQIVNFASGETSKTVVIPINNDLLVEGDETVDLSLSNPTGGATLGTQDTAILTILDDDVILPKPVVFVGALDPSAGEPGLADGNGVFQFARTGGDLSQAVTVRYTVTGTATAGTDYTPLSGTVTIAAGQTVSAPVNVVPLADSRNEPVESVIVKVAEDTAYQVGSADTASVRILDNNPLTGTPPVSGFVLQYNSSGAFQAGYNNITTAVAAANPNDILFVQAGTYNEPGTVVINKPLTLRGENAGVSTANGSAVDPAVVQTTAGLPIFTISPGVNNVTIEGLTIQMGGDNAIRLQGASNNLVIRQNTFTGNGPNNGGVIFLDTGLNPSTGSVEVIDNLIRDVSVATGSVTSGVQAFRFDQVRITDNTIANLTGPGIAADAIANSASVIINNNISNIREQGIQLAGGSARIDNNDITNVNTANDIDRGGIRLRDSGFGTLALGTVDVLSNVITNSYNGVAIRNGTNITGTVRVNNNNLIGNSNAGLYHGGTGAVDGTNNWWDDINGPVVGTGPNAIAGAGAASVTGNPFSTTVL
ncbi:MAG TPA: hypothetical protein DCY88_04545, partial [Cyanobacteria bacterium UBA11372]|nr:hypothetical protein [Cyanobacteria bacterium UBA11372]